MLKHLEDQGYFILDHFLSQVELADINADYNRLYEQGAFSLAGTGNKKNNRNTGAGIRSDETYWFDPMNLTQPQQLVWSRLEAIKNEVNESFFMGLWDLEGHYSRYPAGGYYQKHLDRFATNDQRTLSTVVYLNETWSPMDGGELRLYDQIDVAPIPGRLVCFLSGKVPHEVLVTNQIRKSFAGWWKRRP